MIMSDVVKKSLPYLVVLVVGMGIGWGVKPTKIETKEKEKLVEVEKKDTRIDTLLTQIAQLNRDYQEMKSSQTSEKLHKEILETTAADGSKTKKTTIDKNVDSIVQETKHEVEVKVVTVEKQVLVTQTVTVEKVVEKTKTVTPKLADWHIGLLAGIKPTFSPLSIGGLQLGAEVEHRFIGPTFLGVQVTGSPTKFEGIQILGKLGFEF